MNQRFYRPFILVILALMLTPVLLFNDQESMLKARGVTRYAPCYEIDHRVMVQRCMREVHQARLARCNSFPVDELKNSCVENVDHELSFEKNQQSSKLSFSLRSYSSLFLVTLVAFVLLTMVKGPLPPKVPAYQKLLQSLPRSEYFAGQTLMSLTRTLFALCFLIIFFLEMAFMLKI